MLKTECQLVLSLQCKAGSGDMFSNDIRLNVSPSKRNAILRSIESGTVKIISKEAFEVKPI